MVCFAFFAELYLKDALKIWDFISFVGHPTYIFYKVYNVALAIFEFKRSKIIGMDIPAIVLQLQNLHDVNDVLNAIYRKIMKDNGMKIKKTLGY